MIEQLLDTILISASIPLIAVLLYVYNKSKYNLLLISAGSIVAILTSHLLSLTLYTQPIVQGVYFFPQTFLYMIVVIVLAYYMIQDKLWTLLSVLTLMTFTYAVIALTHQIPLHGAFSIPIAVFVWAWYKESPRCFNPIKCPIMKLEGKYV